MQMGEHLTAIATDRCPSDKEFAVHLPNYDRSTLHMVGKCLFLLRLAVQPRKRDAAQTAVGKGTLCISRHLVPGTRCIGVCVWGHYMCPPGHLEVAHGVWDSCLGPLESLSGRLSMVVGPT